MTRHLPLLFCWQAARDLRSHPLLAILNVLSVGLGIAVFLAIQIANGSANRAFAATVEMVAGKAHLEVRGRFDESLWPKVAAVHGVKAVTGTVEGVVTLPDHPGEYLRVLGVDPLSSGAFLTFELDRRAEGFQLEPWLRTPNSAALTEEMAARLHVREGDTLRVLVNGRIANLVVSSLLDTSDSPGAADPRFAAMDIGWAQELFCRQGRLSSLLILLENPHDAERIAAEINAFLPADVRAQPPRQRSNQLQQMVSAFQLNLTALSMVSLLVGAFLVYNTVSASVSRRRREIGILRAVGTRRSEVRALFLGEACVYGVIGIALGCVAGVLIAPVLAKAVAGTISSLYVLVSVARVTASPLQFATAICVGLATVIAGAWLPANEAASTNPVRALSLGTLAEQTNERAGGWGWAGLGSLILAFAAATGALLRGPAPLAFLCAFGVLASAAFYAPLSIRVFGRLANNGAPEEAILWRLSADRFRRAIHRNGITIAALATAIAMMTGLTIMIVSFRHTVTAWIDSAIVADLLVAPSSNEVVGLSATVPSAMVDWLRNRPEVASVDTFREQRALVSVGDAAPREALIAVAGGQYRNNLRFLKGDGRSAGARIFSGEAVAVSEPFSRRWNVRVNDLLTVRTPAGLHSVPIAGIYADYTRDEGIILMSRKTFDAWWNEPGVQSLAVYLRDRHEDAALADALRTTWSHSGEFNIYTNRALRERVLAIFDQTFAVTALLRVVAVIVAVLGIFLSISTLVLERERETGTLRAIGASHGQIMRMTVYEAALTGAVAAALGTTAGCMLAIVLTHVVNPAFFGWTIELYWPWTNLGAAAVWLVLAAAVAAMWPAHRAARVNIAQAVREE